MIQWLCRPASYYLTIRSKSNDALGSHVYTLHISRKGSRLLTQLGVFVGTCRIPSLTFQSFRPDSPMRVPQFRKGHVQGRSFPHLPFFVPLFRTVANLVYGIQCFLRLGFLAPCCQKRFVQVFQGILRIDQSFQEDGGLRRNNDIIGSFEQDLKSRDVQ